MTDTQAALIQHLATLRTRETAAAQLMAGQAKPHTKCPDKAAKLPETERAQLTTVHKWEARHKMHPTDFTRTKLAKAQARLANTQRQMAKLARNPFIKDLRQLRKEIAKTERALARIEQANNKKQKELSALLTELYDIDSITGVITKRANSMPIKSATIMVNGVRFGIDKARQLLLAGGLV